MIVALSLLSHLPTHTHRQLDLQSGELFSPNKSPVASLDATDLIRQSLKATEGEVWWPTVCLQFAQSVYQFVYSLKVAIGNPYTFSSVLQGI